ncbi:MAG: NAD-dependent epimerase/dehydratase family protein, partial [Novosphingobium sp.]
MGMYSFKLPDIGEGIAEAEIVAWHVAVGDMVEEDAPLADVMTDKATVEMTSPVTGRITRQGGDVGEMIAIGAILVETLNRFMVPAEVQGQTMVVVAGIGIAINTFTALLFMRGRKHDINVRGTENLLQASAAAGVKRFVHGSTIGVYGEMQDLTDETTACNPDNIYGTTKLEGEKKALSYNDQLPVVVI